ncbi:MAG TPA: F0F1 ATP synthase subunit delta [Candidatus Saccharimonadales bacterium]
MKQPRTQLARTIADTTLKKGVSKKYAQEIAAYLLTEGRVQELDSLLRDVQADWAEAGQVEVIATSAHPLTAQIKTTITKQIKQLYPEAKNIIITEVHNPEVIGGVRVSLANQQLDLSIEAQLNRFKQLTTQGKE